MYFIILTQCKRKTSNRHRKTFDKIQHPFIRTSENQGEKNKGNFPNPVKGNYEEHPATIILNPEILNVKTMGKAKLSTSSPSSQFCT